MPKKNRDIKKQDIPIQENKIYFDFSYIYLWESIRLKNGFHNFLKNSDDWATRLMEIFKIVRVLTGTPTYKLQDNNTHCHEIKKTKNIDIFDSVILGKIKKYIGDKESSEEHMKQIFANGNRRFQACVSNRTHLNGLLDNTGRFLVMFFDFYHLVYPSDLHNHKHGDKYNYCPVKKGGSKNDSN